MSWADIKNRYKTGGTVATQSTEDMAARRILRALGLAEKGLPAAEKAAGTAGQRQADTTLLERAGALVGALAPALRKALPPVRDVKNLREAEDAALELAEQRPGGYGLVYRVRGTENLMAMWKPHAQLVDLADVPMPCRLFRSRDGSCVLMSCDAQALYDKLMNREVPNG